jgi:hypothetical protein
MRRLRSGRTPRKTQQCAAFSSSPTTVSASATSAATSRSRARSRRYPRTRSSSPDRRCRCGEPRCPVARQRREASGPASLRPEGAGRGGRDLPAGGAPGRPEPLRARRRARPLARDRPGVGRAGGSRGSPTRSTTRAASTSSGAAAGCSSGFRSASRECSCTGSPTFSTPCVTVAFRTPSPGSRRSAATSSRRRSERIDPPTVAYRRTRCSTGSGATAFGVIAGSSPLRHS